MGEWRDGFACRVGNKRQFLTSIGINGGTVAQQYATPPRPFLYQHLVAREAEKECARKCAWWVITLHALSALRQNSTAAPIEVAPLTEDEILAGQPLGVVGPVLQTQSPQIQTVLKARLILSDGTGRSTIRDVDIGAGLALAWYGASVEIEVAFGRTTQVIQQPGRPATTLAPGQVIEDALVMANVRASEDAPTGHAQTPLLWTQTRQVTDASVFFAKPPGARRLTIYTETPSQVVGAASHRWILFPFSSLDVGSPVGQNGPPVPLIPFAPSQPVPGPAIGVQAAVGTDRNTLVWELEL